jgi:phthiocerol/phenolphthiocerol synthesis type-I polyketide synthase E
MAAIWEDVLRRAPFGVHANYFALGGDSLSAITIMNRVNETFGTLLSIRALFDAPTVAGLCAVVDESVSWDGEEMEP